MAAAREVLERLVTAQAGEARDWLAGGLADLSAGAPERALHIFLGLAPRRLGKADLVITQADAVELDAAHPGLDLTGWSLDGAARVLALTAYAGSRPFAETFKDLRRTADAAELVALYRGLPFYPTPETLDFEVGEGLRSNIAAVFEAIAHRNPWPRDHFDTHRWNHMVLKALFVGSRLSPIVGLDGRANPALARILAEFARERRAAGRPVPAELWRCVGPFAVDEAALADLGRALEGPPAEARAAALALAVSPAPGAGDMLDRHPEAAAIRAGEIDWHHLEEAA